MVVEINEIEIIRDIRSSFVSQLVLVKKKNGSLRLCIDYRQLIKLALKNTFLIPLLEELRMS